MTSHILTAENILERLLSGEPISIIRYGDGEAITLNALNDPGSYTAVLKRQFGRMPTWEDALKIRKNLITALNGADIIGYKHNSREGLGYYWQNSLSILANNVHLESQKYCSIDVHSEFLSKGYFEQLFEHFKDIKYISCRDINKGLEKRGVSGDNYKISGEALFNDIKNKSHYPDQFIKIESWMDKRDCKTLCLVGAGIAGKIYCNWFRDRGGVAFDVGSVMDSWAGYRTRGQGRGRGVIDKEFQL